MQRTKVRHEYSTWKKFKYGVLQGFTLGPIFSNIDLCDVFHIMRDDDIVRFTEDNTTNMRIMLGI